ncbi:MAG TPA: hypothetical protein VJN21_15540 [Candidatus Acidoferrales bacterium]|nr:hypothetical protein [Candidatus Acidoferrales bacterium]
MRKGRIAAVMVAGLAAAGAAKAQDGFWANWGKQVDEALASQPKWVSPLATSSGAISQRLRTDFVRQITPSGTTTWNYGGGRGVNLIPWHKVEIGFNLPPYFQHNTPSAEDGFGDFAINVKYRIAAGNAEHGNYVVSAALGGTFPTGSFKNGSARGSVTPTIYGGRFFGNFTVQSNVGASLPVGDTATLGRSVTWNIGSQYRINIASHAWKLWPEIESNSTFYHGGPNDGRTQDFLTLGMTVNGIQLNRTPGSRLRVTFGTGMQIATTHFHTYNHAVILSSRCNF